MYSPSCLRPYICVCVCVCVCSRCVTIIAANGALPLSWILPHASDPIYIYICVCVCGQCVTIKAANGSLPLSWTLPLASDPGAAPTHSDLQVSV